uniref:methyltransferase domain-containing protein n=1 Tax=Thaumasiovibrio occultus TaxID=1891184 RepID=UPI000B34F27B|nr:methyltransferase domain-containing protein [Thaumasiovibrio occultus]
MKPARISRDIQPPVGWDALPNGHLVSTLFQGRLDEWCPKIFGYHFLKLGGLSCELSSAPCNVSHHILLDRENPHRNVTADPLALPFVEKSIDACLLINQLEYCNDPHALLREIDRVLISDGYLLIGGFNPISLFGLASMLPWKRHKYPWCGRMFTPYRVKDWLHLLNYEVVSHENFGILPATRHEMCWVWMENILSDPLASFGGLYFIVARKRTCPLKPINPFWKLRRPVRVVNIPSAGKVSHGYKKTQR